MALVCAAGFFQIPDTMRALLGTLFGGNARGWLLAAIVVIAASAVHFSLRRLASVQTARGIGPASQQPLDMDIKRAFQRNTRWWRSIFSTHPKGWNLLAGRRVGKIRNQQESIVRRLNDRFTQPSG